MISCDPRPSTSEPAIEASTSSSSLVCMRAGGPGPKPLRDTSTGRRTRLHPLHVSMLWSATAVGATVTRYGPKPNPGPNPKTIRCSNLQYITRRGPKREELSMVFLLGCTVSVTFTIINSRSLTVHSNNILFSFCTARKSCKILNRLANQKV